MTNEIPYSEPEELAAKLKALPPEAEVHIAISVRDHRQEDTQASAEYCFPQEDADVFLFGMAKLFGIDAYVLRPNTQSAERAFILRFGF